MKIRVKKKKKKWLEGVWLRVCHSPQSTSAPPNRLHRSWQRTAHATPSYEPYYPSCTSGTKQLISPQRPAWERERARETEWARGLGWSPEAAPSATSGQALWWNTWKTSQAVTRICSRTKYASYCSEVNQCKVERWRRITAAALPPLSSDTPTAFLVHAPFCD